MAKKLVWSDADADEVLASDFVGAVVHSGSTKITKTLVGSKESLDVYVANDLSVDLDGIYNVSTNATPDSVGFIGHTRAASLDETVQIERSTIGTADSDAVVAANVSGLDVNGFNMLYNGTTWDRQKGTNGIADVNVTNASLTVGDVALANAGLAAAQTGMSGTEAALPTLTDRKYLSIVNSGNQEVYLGPTGVTSSTGFPIYPGVYQTWRAGDSIAMYGICKATKVSTLPNLELA